MTSSDSLHAPDSIAVIGVAGRFPGVQTIAAFWDNLCRGVESIRRFSRDELLAQGRDPGVIDHPAFVGAEGVLDDIQHFDAAFFGFSPREAAVIDPQHRLGLECAWEAFEDAGYDPRACPGLVGVFVGAGLSTYLMRHLLPNQSLLELLGGFPLLIHNDKDFLPTTISHQLDLKGPSMAVGTACSTGLVAIHLACQHLQTYQCDMALAGGVSIQVPQGQGYIYQPDGIYAPDGHCRAFDAQASGTVGGSGVGLVVLKRTADAIRDGDHIYGLILGSAINNDGADKIGYTAPAIDGQATVIMEALAYANVTADSIGYVEAHGTGTALGDPIEVQALTEAFRYSTNRNNYCALGSVKTNLGHLDAAAGAVGLIKTVLMLKHRQLPPSLHFERPNAQIDFAATPFYVNTRLKEWTSDQPRRAGVSAFGIGGTNAHMILQEAPALAPPRSDRPWQILTLSARSAAALDEASTRLAAHLQSHPTLNLGDVAATLALGRRAFAYRRVVVCQTIADAHASLTGAVPARAGSVASGSHRPIVMLFPGQGADQQGMAVELYRDELVFRKALDECAVILERRHAIDLLHYLKNGPPSADAGDHAALVQPALFAVEYALARMWQSWGVQPDALIGHSLGEYVVACLAGVFSLEDGLLLVTTRGRLMQSLPPGGMLSVASAAHELRSLLDQRLAIAAINGPQQCVVSGPLDAIAELAVRLEAAAIPYRRLRVSRAFHSPMIEPLLQSWREQIQRIVLQPPQIPFVSNVTGDWITAAEATNPDYWLKQTRETVRFGDGLSRVFELPDPILLEVGPGRVLVNLASQHPQRPETLQAIATLAHSDQQGSDLEALLTALGRLWLAGAPIEWSQVYAAQEWQRVALPTYPFERQRFWIEPPASGDLRSTVGQPQSAPPLIDLAHFTALLSADPKLGSGSHGVPSIDSYPGLRAGLNALCSSLVYRYFSESGLPLEPGTTYAAPDLAQRLEILPQFQRFFALMLRIVEEDGMIRRAGQQITMLKALDRVAAPQQLAQTLRGQFPMFSGLIELLLHCGEQYRQALATPGAALGVLYPDGRGDFLERTLGSDTIAHTQVDVAIAAIRQLVLHMCRQAGRPLTILEIGVGGGRLTRDLAPLFAEHPAIYYATDISKLFVEHIRAEAERHGWDFIKADVLDVERSPQAQGYPLHSFDLVLGLDVIHATRDLPTSLEHLQALLVPGGVLGLIETTASDRWLSLIWGLSEGWWRFEDGIRQDSPLLNHEQWSSVLAQQRFHTTAVLPAATDARSEIDCGVLLAQTAWTSLPTPGAFDVLPKRPDLSSWGYIPAWKRVPLLGISGTRRARRCLIFGDDTHLSQLLVEQLAAQQIEVMLVRDGSPTAHDDYLVLRPDQPEDYKALWAALRRQNRLPDTVVHLWSMTDPPTSEIDDAALERAQDRGLYSLLWLAQSLGQADNPGQIRMITLTGGVQEVLGGDLVRPEQATILGAVKIIPREYPDVTCSAIDIVPPAPGSLDETWLLRQLAIEILSGGDEVEIAYRGRYRWLPDYAPIRLEPVPQQAPLLRSGGVYLIAGGLGGIGLTLAEYLATTYSADLILTRRSAFPERADWEAWLSGHEVADATSQTIRRLLGIEAQGSRIVVAQADLSDQQRMAALVSEAVAALGPIQGVLHCAGVPDTAGIIHRRSRAATEAGLAAKVRGTFVLERVLRDQPLDFMLLCSSIGTTLYRLKFGEVGYVAANELLNAFALARAQQDRPRVITINWTDWQEAGMWADAQSRLTSTYAAQYEALDHQRSVAPLTQDLLQGISSAEGIEIFRRVLGQPYPRVIISTQELPSLLERHTAFTPDAHRAFLEHTDLTKTGHQRPALDQPFAAPRTETEQAVAQIWQRLLGIAQVGVDDSFFALGGDSLLALRVISRVRDEFGVEIPLAKLFETATVAALAEHIDLLRWAYAGTQADRSQLDEQDQIIL